MALDAVVGIEAVLANGTAVNATSSTYPDLFWALRGAASDFAVVTHYTLQTQPAPTSPTTFLYQYEASAEALGSALAAYQAFAQVRQSL